jgi:4-hydroxythreonine-4-phosphate dehydrogenase
MEKEKEKEVGNPNPTKVGISIGDINGVGPEIIMKALSDNRILLDCTPVIYGSSKVFSHFRKILNDLEFNYQSCKDASAAVNRKINLVNVWDEEVVFETGQVTENGGKYALQSLDRATQDLAAGKIDVLVTAPISKEAMAKSGFKFPGHTEYLADLSGEAEALMLMVSGALRVALVTTHIALKEVHSALTKDKIVSKIKAFEASLKKDFGIIRPKIAVLGLNPHAGENGKMGQEEQELIAPAINQARAEQILAFGPYPADGFFGSRTRNEFDGILAMYHDQGLTAFKALSFEDGVNYTAGLPIVRTSPDHGTAFDIAGKNQASEHSLRNAIYVAIDVLKNRKLFKHMHANPLKISPRDHRKSNSEIE